MFKKVLAILLAVTMAFSVTTLCFAVEIDSESESNNVQADANSITNAISGNLEDINDVDWFKYYSIDNAALLRVDFSHTANAGNGNYFEITVYDADGKTEAHSYCKGSESSINTNYFSAKQGYHYIKVNAVDYASSSITYTVSLTKDSSKVYEREPNNTWTEANSVPIPDGKWYSAANGSMIYGYVYAGDEDHYYLTSTKTGFLTAQLRALNGEHKNISVELYQMAGTNTSVTKQVIGSATMSSTQTSAMTSSVSIGAGTYYAVVKGADVNSDFGGYTLDFYFAYDENREVEYNGDKASATYLKRTNGSETLGSIGDITDKDYYRVEITDATKNFKITMKPYGASQGGWHYVILKENDTKISEGYFSSNQSAEYSFADNDSGTYYIVIEKGTSWSNANYTITATDVPRISDPDPWWVKILKFILKILNIIKESVIVSQLIELIEKIGGSGILKGIISAIESIIAAAGK